MWDTEDKGGKGKQEKNERKKKGDEKLSNAEDVELDYLLGKWIPIKAHNFLNYYYFE